MATKKSEDLRREIAEMFIEGLKENGLHWKKGWSSESMCPSNGKSRIPYKGINRMHLFMHAQAEGYKDARWFTFLQIKEAGYHLKKGAKGVKVEYWFPYDCENRKSLSWQEYKECMKSRREKEEFALLCKTYTVFNADRVEGIERTEFENRDVNPSAVIETLSQNMGVSISYANEDIACYKPSSDEIQLPPPSKFYSTEEFNATALHELAHSTGHAKRLDRDQSGRFGSKEYAFEELVAEMASVFMGVHTGIDPLDANTDNHQAYVNSWIEEIERSPDVLAKAIRQAEEATEYMEFYVEINNEIVIKENKW